MAEPASGVAQLTEALVECTAPITQILDHMARAPTAPDIDAAVACLRSVLADALAPLETRVAAGDLETAASVIRHATEAILSEIILVPHASSGGAGRDCETRRR